MGKMKRQPTHPGKIIREDYLEPLGIPVTDMANLLGISRKTLSKILNQRGSVTPDMALRLSKAFKTTPELWLNMQQNFDLWQASHKSADWKMVEAIAV